MPSLFMHVLRVAKGVATGLSLVTRALNEEMKKMEDINHKMKTKHEHQKDGHETE